MVFSALVANERKLRKFTFAVNVIGVIKSTTNELSTEKNQKFF